MKKTNIEDVFKKWFYLYKKNLSFSILNKPIQAMMSSFNAGYSLAKKEQEQLKRENTFLKEQLKEILGDDELF